ncbi:MAG: sigma-70 family RNA polymerase sigma factor [Chloroflexi bacterium]|nr:sigma-70 family RNA polymerase sigma factor [Chloroflexota bacterium]
MPSTYNACIPGRSQRWRWTLHVRTPQRHWFMRRSGRAGWVRFRSRVAVSRRSTSVRVIDEERWLDAARAGDADAFNHLVERYQSLAYSVACRTLADPEAAADATQEAFFSAFRAIAGFRGGSFQAWLLRIVVNACYDARRYANRRPATSMDRVIEEMGEAPWPDQHAVNPETAVLSQETLATLEGALAELPDEQRLAIVLVDIEGLTYEEAADVMGRPVGTVRSRLARGRARVRDILVATGNLS